MKSAIVSGATGFIGLHLCKELDANHVRVTGLVRRDSINTARILDNAELIWCGMDDYEQLHSVSADTFYHLAWEGATGTGRDDELLQARNITRTVAALKAAKRIGCRRFVVLGTVYENLVSQILSEKSHRKADFYLLAKRSSHEMCLKLAEKLDMEFIWATIFQPIGRYIKKEQMMSYAISGLLSGQSPMFGPAMQPYDITAVEDVAYGLRLLGDGDLSRKEYYIGSGQPMLMKDYLQKTKDILKTDTELKIGTLPDDGLRFFFDWYDISPLQAETGYHVRVGFDKAVLNVADWIMSQEQAG